MIDNLFRKINLIKNYNNNMNYQNKDIFIVYTLDQNRQPYLRRAYYTLAEAQMNLHQGEFVFNTPIQLMQPLLQPLQQPLQQHHQLPNPFMNLPQNNYFNQPQNPVFPQQNSVFQPQNPIFPQQNPVFPQQNTVLPPPMNLPPAYNYSHMKKDIRM
jgi:hypothetical protein